MGDLSDDFVLCVDEFNRQYYYRVSYRVNYDGIVQYAKTNFTYPFLFKELGDAKRFIDDISEFTEVMQVLQSIYPTSKFEVIHGDSGTSIYADSVAIIQYSIEHFDGYVVQQPFENFTTK